MRIVGLLYLFILNNQRKVATPPTFFDKDNRQVEPVCWLLLSVRNQKFWVQPLERIDDPLSLMSLFSTQTLIV